MRLRSKAGGRSGATAVEFAIVFTLVFMFLIGIFEFARLIFMRELCESATREGARYAIVSTYSDADPKAQNIIKIVTQQMSGMTGQITNYSVSVYAVNANGTPNTATTAQGSYDPTVTTFTSIKAGTAPNSYWYDASFAEGIGVEVDGSYSPIAAGLLGLPNSFNVTFRTILSSEAN